MVIIDRVHFLFLLIAYLKYHKIITLNEMTNMIEKALEILMKFYGKSSREGKGARK